MAECIECGNEIKGDIFTVGLRAGIIYCKECFESFPKICSNCSGFHAPDKPEFCIRRQTYPTNASLYKFGCEKFFTPKNDGVVERDERGRVVKPENHSCLDCNFIVSRYCGVKKKVMEEDIKNCENFTPRPYMIIPHFSNPAHSAGPVSRRRKLSGGVIHPTPGPAGAEARRRGETDEENSKIDYDLSFLDWIIIGAQTRPEFQPDTDWVDGILGQADRHEIPVYMKNNLKWPHHRREFPNGGGAG